MSYRWLAIPWTLAVLVSGCSGNKENKDIVMQKRFDYSVTATAYKNGQNEVSIQMTPSSRLIMRGAHRSFPDTAYYDTDFYGDLFSQTELYGLQPLYREAVDKLPRRKP